MAIKVTNKKPLTGNKRSHALNATKMQQKPNLQVVRLEDGTKVIFLNSQPLYEVLQIINR